MFFKKDRKKKIKLSEPLSRCPFCGGQPIIERYNSDYDRGELTVYFSIRCASCGIRKEEKTVVSISDWGEINCESGYQKLVDFWENRVDESEVTQGLQEKIIELEARNTRLTREVERLEEEYEKDD